MVLERSTKLMCHLNKKTSCFAYFPMLQLVPISSHFSLFLWSCTFNTSFTLLHSGKCYKAYSQIFWIALVQLLASLWKVYYSQFLQCHHISGRLAKTVSPYSLVPEIEMYCIFSISIQYCSCFPLQLFWSFILFRQRVICSFSKKPYCLQRPTLSYVSNLIFTVSF